MRKFSPQKILAMTVCLILAGCAATQKPAPTAAKPATSDAGDFSSVMSDLGEAACTKGSLDSTLGGIAQTVERQRLLYSVKERTDCSGIFHRVMDEFRTQCPGPDYPPAASRDTREIAKWYAKQQRMVWIDQPLTQDNLIRVGAVMFFGQRDTKYTPSQLGTDLMYQRGKGINHVGIVTKVKMTGGHVEQYWMLHGHGKTGVTMAGVTSTKYVNQTGETKYNNQNRKYVSRSRGQMTPYGNWDEQWLGVAPVLDAQRLSSNRQ
jgi:hypothetical protein